MPLVLLTLPVGCDDEDNGDSDTAADSGSSGQDTGNGEGGSNSELEDIVDGAVALSEEASEALSGTCDCWEAFSFESQEQCEMTLVVEDTSFDRECLLEALSMDSEAAIENFNCERPALEELITCFTDALDVCDVAAFSACTDTPEPDCPELPPAVDAASEACVGA